ncbi:MAG: LPXTG cell wall anchor domain-containing protein [Roseovarius sp.]
MRFILTVLLLPAPALAHSGPHLHPHGIDVMWLVVVGLLALGGGYLIGRGRK